MLAGSETLLYRERMGKVVDKVSLSDEQQEQMEALVRKQLPRSGDLGEIVATVVAAAAMGDTDARTWLRTRNGFDASVADALISDARSVLDPKSSPA